MLWKRTRHYLLCLLVGIVVLMGLFYFGGYQSDLSDVSESTLSANQMGTEMLSEGMQLSQEIEITHDVLSALSMQVAAGQTAHFHYELTAVDTVLLSGDYDQTVTDAMIDLAFDSIDVSDYDRVTLTMTALAGNDLQFFYSDMVMLSRGMVAISDLTADNSLLWNDQVMQGKLNLSIIQETPYNVSRGLGVCLLALLILWVLLYVYSAKNGKQERPTILSNLALSIDKYGYMLQQLVSRDFKTKYKRSVLGVLWSFLNPLLTMAIQYMVFSTLFKSDIAYFPVYLLSGTICFSLFSESTSTGLNSIAGNAGLLTKVYIPKYIFPISCVLSSTINFSLTLIPLFLVAWISGLSISSAYLFLPFTFLCLLVFCTGIALFLASIMVFFRDVQFLWGVLTTLLIYCTPIFYPETIIPENFTFMFQLNPLYHVIRIVRTILIDGAPPTPQALIVCALGCSLFMVVGLLVFKKNQDKFVLNL